MRGGWEGDVSEVDRKEVLKEGGLAGFKKEKGDGRVVRRDLLVAGETKVALQE